MKTFYFLTIGLLFFGALLVVVTGCKVDVAQPSWNQPAASGAASPTITGIVPADSASVGVNTITIQGQNFNDTLGGNIVYINGLTAEITSSSNSSITIRRPNVVSNSASINVVSNGALLVAKYAPYKITSVWEKFGSSAVQISAIDVDKNENLYFAEQVSGNVVKVTPSGVKTTVGNTGTIVSEIKIAPNGKLYLLNANSTEIQQMDVTTGTRTHWVTEVNRLTCGDFDANGNFYVSGTLRNIYVIGSDTSKKTVSGYSTESVLAIRVYNNYVYVLSSGSTVSLWRNQILDASGNLGSRQLVVNLTAANLSTAAMFTIDANGKIYFGMIGTNPIVMYNLSNGNQDILYKGILPTTAYKLIWGTGSRLYMIYNGTGTTMGIVRIDAGTAGAPYFGRK